MDIKAQEILLGSIQPQGAVEQIVRRIGEAIGAGLLAPGERLPPEQELAARLEVAPMTLRQALAILREAGFIETRRGRAGGSFVRVDAPAAVVAPDAGPPSASVLRELTDWRRAVSGEAAALAAARRDASDVARLGRLADAVEVAVDDRSVYRLADARFHVAIAEVARSQRLVVAETELQVEVAELLAFAPGPASARQVSQAGHAPVVGAIAEGDADGARSAMLAHVEATHDWIVGLRLGRLGR
jgi:GntR family transcriptional repressor for pyruvate dehydrogenase complex